MVYEFYTIISEAAESAREPLPPLVGLRAPLAQIIRPSAALTSEKSRAAAERSHREQVRYSQWPLQLNGVPAAVDVADPGLGVLDGEEGEARIVGACPLLAEGHHVLETLLARGRIGSVGQMRLAA